MMWRAAAGDTLATLRTSGDNMSEILRFVSTAWTSSSEIDSVVPVAIFCGIGMLASLLAIIFDQDIFSAWSYF
jgi:hypothetical protein